MGRIRKLAVLLCMGVMCGPVGCGDEGTGQVGGVLFTIDVLGEQFQVLVLDEARIRSLEGRLANGTTGVIGGHLLPGDGGFNTPWSWHLDPATVYVADTAIELCDGRPSMVEENLGYWLGTVKQYCPWGAKVVKRSG